MTTETIEITIQKISKSKLDTVDFANLGFGKYFSDYMFSADYLDGEWRNLQILPYGKLSFEPSLLALHYGQSIFEGLKAYYTEQGDIAIFRPDQNLQRLNKSAQRMAMPTLPEEIFIEGLHKLIDLDRNWIPKGIGESLYIRPFMFASDEAVGMRPSNSYKFIIFTSPVGAYYAEPVRVKIETHYTRAVEGGTGFAKTSGNYAASLYPTQLAAEQGYQQLIWTDGKEHKYLEEAGTMNLMFIINGTVLTAPLGDTVLDGITRKSILHLAKSWGYPVEERKIAATEIIDAIQKNTLQEAFGVGTAAVVTLIKAIGFEGMDYDLKALTDESFALRAKKYLTDLNKGKIQDEFGWIYKIA